MAAGPYGTGKIRFAKRAHRIYVLVLFSLQAGIFEAIKSPWASDPVTRLPQSLTVS
jgi:hypothetical protein